jgi:hypothetical protein
MKLEKSIFQRSHLYFLVFFLAMLAAFWLTYFTKILEQENYRLHLHGLTLILWCLMLVVQPWLIRTKQRSLHQRIGTFSYLLVPLLVFTTLDLFIFRMQQAPALDNAAYMFVALVVNALVVFLILYGLAIYHKHKPTVHARYMLCTAFPMFTPITDRIISIYFPSMLKYIPVLEGQPVVPAVGFLLADLLLIGLSIWDWRSHKRWNVFPVALALLLAYHISFFTFYQYPFWISFSHWLLGR